MIKLLFHAGYIGGLGSEGTVSRGRDSPIKISRVDEQEAHHFSATCPLCILHVVFLLHFYWHWHLTTGTKMRNPRIRSTDLGNFILPNFGKNRHPNSWSIELLQNSLQISGKWCSRRCRGLMEHGLRRLPHDFALYIVFIFRLSMYGLFIHNLG